MASMHLKHPGFILAVMMFASPKTWADAVQMHDFIYLRTGMSEAEVLYRIGPSDHETVAYDYFHNILHKIWYYIPGKDEASNKKWITEIHFNRDGRITALDRYKPE